jgi:hypothetical protein
VVKKSLLAVLTAGHFVMDLYTGLVPVLLRSLAAEFDRPLGELMKWYGFWLLFLNLMQPVVGFVSRWVGTRTMLLVAPVLATSVALMGVGGTFVWTAVAVFAGFAGIAAFHPHGLMAAHDVSGEKEHLGVPIFLSAGYFGQASGSQVAGLWVSAWGFAGFWFLALPGLLLSVLFGLLGIGRKPPRPEDVSDEEAAAAETARREEEERTDAAVPHFVWVFLIAACIATAHTLVMSMLPAHIQDGVMFGLERGLPLGGTSLLLIGLIGTLGAALVWGPVSGRIPPFLLVGCGCLLAMPCLLRLTLAETALDVYLWSVLAGTFGGPAFFAVVATVGRRARGFTRALRAGLVIGGAWGVGAMVQSGYGWLMEAREVPLILLLWTGMGYFALAGVLSLFLHEAGYSRRGGA